VKIVCSVPVGPGIPLLTPPLGEGPRAPKTLKREKLEYCNTIKIILKILKR